MLYNQNVVTSYPSPATAYEVALAELNNKPQDEKIVKVFEILDEVVPKLGTYSKIMNIVRQQLFDSVFSDRFTGSVNSDIGEKKISIERLSYFALYNKIKRDRDEANENLKHKLNQTEKELAEKNEQIKSSKEKIESLEGEIKNFTGEVRKLSEEIAEKKVEIYRAEKKLRVTNEEFTNQVEDLKSNVDTLKTKLNRSEEEVTDLSIYKNAYDEVHTSFAPSISDDFTRPRRKQIQMTRKNQILTDITNANKLEEQILTLINIATEEYDKHVEEFNKKLTKLKSGDSPLNTKRSANTDRNSSSQLNEAEFNILNQEIAIEKGNFKRSILDLKNELDLLAQHKKSLEEKLYLIEMDRDTQEFIKRQRASFNETSQKGLLAGLEEHYEPERKGPDRDQFIPQERILAKYSCMLYTSANGNNWKEMKENKYCENCGDKTFVCPHKVTITETVFKLPGNTSFIKLVRPRIHYNQAVVKQAVEVFKKGDFNIPGVDYQSGDHSVVLTNYPAKYLSNYDQNNEALKLLNEGNPDAGFLRTFQILWDDFNQRNIFEKRVARPFTYERTISLFVQFLAFLHDKESYSMGVSLSIVDNLYQFFDKRYDLEDIKFSAVYDFLASIYSIAPKSKVIEVFCHTLVGNLDRSVLNYILYMAEIIEKVEWKETEDVKPLFEIIYPFCDDDELDALTLDYTSYTENKINKKLVLEFIMSLILQRKEYLINEMQFKLSTQPTQSYYMMNEIEFTKTMEEFFYIYEEKQTKVYYETSLKYCMSFDGYTFCVPIDKLCYIAAYYYLIQIAQELKRDINDIISDAREKRLKEQVGTLDKSRQLVPWKDEFIKITDVDNLAAAMAIVSGPRDDDDFEMSMLDRKQPSMW